MGHVIQTTFPSTLTETYGYDQLYNLTSKTDRKGQTIQYVYDSLYRMTSKTYPDEASASYVYDLVGKIQQVTDPTGTYGFAYDNMGRLIGTSTQYTFLGNHNCWHNMISALTRTTPEMKCSPNLHSLGPVPIHPESRSDNCSIANLQEPVPTPVSPDCDAYI
jgi:YD repeat-containing protein